MYLRQSRWLVGCGPLKGAWSQPNLRKAVHDHACGHVHEHDNDNGKSVGAGVNPSTALADVDIDVYVLVHVDGFVK